MFHKIKKVEALSNFILKINFENNEIKYYDMKKVIEKYKEFNILKNESFFKNAHIDIGGYAVVWDDDLDIACEELYKNGSSKLEI